MNPANHAATSKALLACAEANPGLGFGEVSKKVGEMWKALEDKYEFEVCLKYAINFQAN